jgi:hypothetical protein
LKRAKSGSEQDEKVQATASTADARYDEPSPEGIKEFAFSYMKQFPKEFYNSVSKKEWCERIKAFGIKTFGWGGLFKVDDK